MHDDEERDRPGVTNQTIKEMRKEINRLKKRADRIEQVQADTSMAAVVFALRDIADAIREGGGSQQGGMSDLTADEAKRLMANVQPTLDRLKDIKGS